MRRMSGGTAEEVCRFGLLALVGARRRDPGRVAGGSDTRDAGGDPSHIDTGGRGLRDPGRAARREWHIARLAGRQRGLVTRGQLLACGLSPGAIDWRVKTGRLHLVHPGVYAVGHRVLAAWAR